MGETSKILAPLSGDKLYQKRARAAFPLLVREALGRKTILYSQLAAELGMPNARNLNYPLGSIGGALEALSEEWDENIPPLQCLVVNQRYGLPGEGIGWFITKKHDFHKLSRSEQRMRVRAELLKVFEYPKWFAVLEALGFSTDFADVLDKAKHPPRGGESQRHRRLKEYVANSPRTVNLSRIARVDTEYILPSGDIVDVLFRVGDDWIAVEVKSDISNTGDIARGMFQCVKYKAVIEAYQAAQYLPQSARTILVLEEGKLPAELVPMKDILGIKIVNGVRPK
jgi:hypothetical protein